MMTVVFLVVSMGVSRADERVFSVLSDGGIPPPPAQLFIWPTNGCSNTYNDSLDPTAPEGARSFVSASTDCPFFGWGVFTNMDMSAYTNGAIQFYLKSTTSLLLELESLGGRKAGTTIPSTEGEWKHQTVPVSTFTSGGIQLNKLYGIFLITSINPVPTTFYVDYVRWSKASLLVDTNPALSGQWSSVFPWFTGTVPSVPIHMHLLPTGKVMYWDRHGRDPENPNIMWEGAPAVWDPMTQAFASLPMPDYDIFCSGHSILSDGRLFVSGGHVEDLIGEDKASIYDPFANSWLSVRNMNAGRWYPTSITLADGDVLTIAGTLGTNVDRSSIINPLPQVWQVSDGAWRDLPGAMLGRYPFWPNFYPWIYVAPNGKVFNAGPQQTARYLDTSGTGIWTDVAQSSMPYRDYGSSAMYDDAKFLIVGGSPGNPHINPTFQPTSTAEVINLNASPPLWRPTAPMHFARRHHSATILADGSVLVTGGTSTAGFDTAHGAVFFAEVWNPVTERWTLLASGNRYRGYHSVALLLPDARVIVAGGGHPDSVAGAQTNAEIFSPPYLFRGERPTISAAPIWVRYGQSFNVETIGAATIANVNWVRLGSITHGFNQNQRINRLAFNKSSGRLDVIAPTDANLCPPGHYLMFILNSNGVPSVARTIQIGKTNAAVLSITQIGENEVISWPSTAGDFVLQYSDRLSSSNSWTNALPLPAPFDYRFVFTNNALFPHVFFRLGQSNP